MTVPIAAPEISTAAKEAVMEVLDSGMIADGEQVRRFEAAFAEYVGTEHAIATSSGTTALHAMFEAAGIGEDDVVVTSPFSFISSANAIKHAGAEPIFADVDPETFNLDPEATRELLEQRSDITAIMPIHLYGLPADMGAFQELAAEFDLQLFADAAQAHGATYTGTKTGSIGDAAAFSFYPTKNMTTGEGGIVTTDDTTVAERTRRLVDHGRTGRYSHAEIGYNYRLTNISAVIGRDQLERLPEWVERRQRNASRLTDILSSVSGVAVPTVPEDRTHAYHQYTIRIPNRDAVTSALDEAEIGYGIYYPETIPGQPAYDEQRGWPVAERLTEEVLSIPVHPFLDSEDVDRVAEAVERGVKQ